MTNCEKIKSMSAEEMAEYFARTQSIMASLEWGVDADYPTAKSIKQWLESEGK